jgi:CubicO group peptidase (beta-lactamase class C family)
MSNPIRPGITTTPIDRRKVLRHSAAGLAIPALAAAGRPAGGAAHSALDNAMSSIGIGGATSALSGGGLSQERLEQMHEAMTRHVDSGRVPGLVTLISRRGEVHVDAIGMTAFERGEPMRRDTIFRIASVTKPIVAAAAMLLVEECTLRLDDPVDELLPELADRQVLRAIDGPLGDTVPATRPITVRDLLTFRAGYGAIFTPSPLQEAMTEAGVGLGPFLPEVSPDEYMKRLGALPQAHQPGARWLYNSGADILGVLIARAAGMSLGELLQERIFAPLGMKDTAFSVPASKRDRLATAYWTNFETGEFGVFDDVTNSRWSSPPAFESGASGLVSTVDDLHAFGQLMLANGKHDDARLLSRPAIAVMTTDQITAEQKAASASEFFPGFWDAYGWGFGIAVDTRRDDLATPGRYGWDGGYGTSWWVDPVEELIGILLTQRVWDEPVVPPMALRDFWTSVYQAIDD